MMKLLFSSDKKKVLHEKEAVKKKEKNEVDKSVIELMPIKLYDQENKCYILEDGRCMDFLQINSKDLDNVSDDEIQFDMMKFEKLYKTYMDDVKIIFMNFPCSTLDQQNYLIRKLELTDEPKKKYWLERKLKEEIWIEKNKSAREFYMMFFSASVGEHDRNRRKIQHTLKSGVDGLVSEIDFEKKNQILAKLANKNIVIGR